MPELPEKAGVLIHPGSTLCPVRVSAMVRVALAAIPPTHFGYTLRDRGGGLGALAKTQ